MQKQKYRSGRRLGGPGLHPLNRVVGIHYGFRPETYPTAGGVMHPFLPPLRVNEVEIAQLLLHTVHEDVISIRVGRSSGGGLLRYRVVDEHGGNYMVRPATGRYPLTLGELVMLIETARHETDSPLGIALLDYQYRSSRLPASVWADFLEVQSTLYLQLRNHYRAAVAMWLRSKEGGRQ